MAITFRSALALLAPLLLAPHLCAAFRASEDAPPALAAAPLEATPLEAASLALASSQNLARTARASRMLLPKWHGITAALLETAAAATSASQMVSDGEGRWNDLARTMGESADLAEVLDGDVTYYQVRDLSSGAAALSIAAELRSLAQNISEFAKLESDIIDALVSTTGLTSGLSELAGSWQAVDMSLVRGLAPSADDLRSRADAVARRLDAALTMLEPLLEDWDSIGAWTKARRTYVSSDVLTQGINDIGESNLAIGEFFHDTARTLARNVRESADSLSEACGAISLQSDHGLGAEETIERHSCEPPHVRTFSAGRLVDETTMTCVQYPLMGFKRCSCTRSEDCYVTSKFRTTRPELKRCFRPV